MRCKKTTKGFADTSLRDLQDLMAKGVLKQEGTGIGTSYTRLAKL